MPGDPNDPHTHAPLALLPPQGTEESRDVLRVLHVAFKVRLYAGTGGD
jgi:hypothetical protein